MSWRREPEVEGNVLTYYRSAAYFIITLFVYNSQYTIALTYIHYSNKICLGKGESASKLAILRSQIVTVEPMLGTNTKVHAIVIS